MSHFSIRATLVAALILLAMASAPAMAQNTTNTSSSEAPETVEISIDNSTRVIDSNWDGATVTMVVESDIPRRIVLTDASQRIDGAIDIRRKVVTIPGGERAEINFTVKNEQNAAVTVASGRSIVGIGRQPAGGPIQSRDPVAFSDAMLLVGFAALATGGGTFLIVRKRRETDDKRVERVA